MRDVLDKSKMTSVICFTAAGRMTAARIGAYYRCPVWCKKKESSQALQDRIFDLEGSLSEWTGKRFTDCSRIVFVGAAGIAVRSIAPYLKSKTKDPAVLCVDESGKFVIPLVSGHIGGANEDARSLAEYLGAVPVITTATDLNGLFAVDVFARKNDLRISDMRLAKEISAALLDGKKVGFSCEVPVYGTFPEELTVFGPECLYHIHTGLYTVTGWRRHLQTASGPDLSGQSAEEKDNADAVMYPVRDDERVWQSLDRMEEEKRILYLVPVKLVLGAGCRRGKDPEQMKTFLGQFLEEEGLEKASVASVCSIDLKKDEKALLAAAASLEVPFCTFSAEELKECPGHYTASGFVSDVTGVDNVCERSAVLGSGGGKLLVRKRASEGMTAAAAAADWEVRF